MNKKLLAITTLSLTALLTMQQASAHITYRPVTVPQK